MNHSTELIHAEASRPAGGMGHSLVFYDNENLQIQKLETTHIYHLIVSVGQEPGHGRPGSPSTGPQSCNSGCQPGLRSCLRLGVFFQAHVVGGRLCRFFAA